MPLAELLFWPALLAYGEAAVAYLSDARHPGTAGRLATWGVRIGWLVQTALLDRAGRARRRFPVVDMGRLAEPLRLARRRRLSDLGLPAALPATRSRSAAAAPSCCSCSPAIGGGTGIGDRSHYSNVFLVLHVGLVLAAFAGFTLAAALSALYLWQERRLQATAETLDPPAARTRWHARRRRGATIAFALPALTLGIAVGVVRLRERRRRARRADGRHRRHLDGVRRLPRACATSPAGAAAARRISSLAGFVLVAVVRLGAPGHPLRDMSIVARRHLASQGARRAARARGARLEARGGAGAHARR